MSLFHSFFKKPRPTYRPFKVCDIRRRKRISIYARKWKDFLEQSLNVLRITRPERYSFRVLRDEDGEPFLEKDFFDTPYHTTMIFLTGGQVWFKRPVFLQCILCRKFHMQRLWNAKVCIPPRDGAKLVVKLADEDRELSFCDVTQIMKNEISVFNFSSVHFIWPERDLMHGYFWRIEGRSYLHMWVLRKVVYGGKIYYMSLHEDYFTNTPNEIKKPQKLFFF